MKVEQVTATLDHAAFCAVEAVVPAVSTAATALHIRESWPDLPVTRPAMASPRLQITGIGLKRLHVRGPHHSLRVGSMDPIAGTPGTPIEPASNVCVARRNLMPASRAAASPPLVRSGVWLKRHESGILHSVSRHAASMWTTGYRLMSLLIHDWPPPRPPAVTIDDRRMARVLRPSRVSGQCHPERQRRHTPTSHSPRDRRADTRSPRATCEIGGDVGPARRP